MSTILAFVIIEFGSSPLRAEALPPRDSYLTGLVLMTGIFAQVKIHPLLSIPDVGQRTVEVSEMLRVRGRGRISRTENHSSHNTPLIRGSIAQL